MILATKQPQPRLERKWQFIFSLPPKLKTLADDQSATSRASAQLNARWSRPVVLAKMDLVACQEHYQTANVAPSTLCLLPFRHQAALLPLELVGCI